MLLRKTGWKIRPIELEHESNNWSRWGLSIIFESWLLGKSFRKKYEFDKNKANKTWLVSCLEAHLLRMGLFDLHFMVTHSLFLGSILEKIELYCVHEKFCSCLLEFLIFKQFFLQVLIPMSIIWKNLRQNLFLDGFLTQ